MIAVVVNGARYSVTAGQILVKAAQVYGTLAVGALAYEAAPNVVRAVKAVAQNGVGDIKWAWRKSWRLSPTTKKA